MCCCCCCCLYPQHTHHPPTQVVASNCPSPHPHALWIDPHVCQFFQVGAWLKNLDWEGHIDEVELASKQLTPYLFDEVSDHPGMMASWDDQRVCKHIRVHLKCTLVVTPWLLCLSSPYHPLRVRQGATVPVNWTIVGEMVTNTPLYTTAYTATIIRHEHLHTQQYQVLCRLHTPGHVRE